MAPLAIPVLPEVLSIVDEQYKTINKQQSRDFASALFNASLGLGQVLGPLFGAPVYALVGFIAMEDILAIICIGFAVLYFILADGMTAFRSTFG